MSIDYNILQLLSLMFPFLGYQYWHTVGTLHYYLIVLFDNYISMQEIKRNQQRA
jgi:hypothetical protein